MRSLESLANDEFLFVSNHVISTVEEDGMQFSQWRLVKKIANLGAIPINLPPSKLQISSIPPYATSSRAISPPLPPELLELLPSSFRKISATEFLPFKVECIDDSVLRTSVDSSNYDFLNDLSPCKEVCPVSNLATVLAFPPPSTDSNLTNRNDTAKSVSSLSTTSSTLSTTSFDEGSSYQKCNSRDESPLGNLTNKNEENSTAVNRNVLSPKMLRNINTAMNTLGASSNKTSEINDNFKIDGNFHLQMEKENKVQPDRLSKCFRWKAESQQRSQQIHSRSNDENLLPDLDCKRSEPEIPSFYVNKEALLVPDRMNGPSESSKGTISENNQGYSALFRKAQSRPLLHMATNLEFEGIYDNFQVIRPELTDINIKSYRNSYYLMSNTGSPLYSFIGKTGISTPIGCQTQPSLPEISDSGLNNNVNSPHPCLSVLCDTFSYKTTEVRRRQSCERPCSPQFGRRSAVRNGVGSSQLNSASVFPIIEGTSEIIHLPSVPTQKFQNVLVDKKDLQPGILCHDQHCSSLYGPHSRRERVLLKSQNQNHICRHKFNSKLKSDQSFLPCFHNGPFPDSRPTERVKGEVKKRYPFYKYMMNLLKKSQ